MNRFKNWKKPVISEGKLTKYNWVVQHKKSLKLGHIAQYIQFQRLIRRKVR